MTQTELPPGNPGRFIMIATLGFLIANRVLPNSDTIFSMPRSSAEVRIFFLVWLAAFAHAWMRPAAAWREQSLAIAIATSAAVLLNWLTTGDTIPASIATGQWGVAGVDMVMLLGTTIAALTAQRLAKRAAATPVAVSHSKTVAAE